MGSWQGGNPLGLGGASTNFEHGEASGGHRQRRGRGQQGPDAGGAAGCARAEHTNTTDKWPRRATERAQTWSTLMNDSMG
eukprot:9041536-Alexandrium_andersonii.AAC.1